MFTIYFDMELKYELYMHLKNQNVQVHEVIGIKYLSYWMRYTKKMYFSAEKKF